MAWWWCLQRSARIVVDEARGALQRAKLGASFHPRRSRTTLGPIHETTECRRLVKNWRGSHCDIRALECGGVLELFAEGNCNRRRDDRRLACRVDIRSITSSLSALISARQATGAAPKRRYETAAFAHHASGVSSTHSWGTQHRAPPAQKTNFQDMAFFREKHIGRARGQSGKNAEQHAADQGDDEGPLLRRRPKRMHGPLRDARQLRARHTCRPTSGQ